MLRDLLLQFFFKLEEHRVLEDATFPGSKRAWSNHSCPTSRAHTRTGESMETGNVWTTISGFPSRVEGMLGE
ncbi:MAG TPA: hypothetical protein VLD83_17100 [Candidatus Binatia bacterium]|nr:hypothetical protein [Candidatus Binatia bacterium]